MGKIRLAQELMVDSIVDGPGLRMVVWVQGCRHNCFKCHNPDTHDFCGGFDKEIEELAHEISSVKLQDGLTLSGGEPFDKVDELCELLDLIKPLNLNIWCYSGYTYDYLKKHPHKSKLLEKIDVIVDGRFEWEQRDFSLKYRGSRNQKIIEVKTEKVLYE